MAEWVQNGLLGTPQYMTISHVYSPEHTSMKALTALVQQDLALAHQLLGAEPTFSSQVLFQRSSSDFGTYAVRFDIAGMPVQWQGLARIGGEAKKPVAQLRLYGSNGMLQSAPAGRGYQLIDWQGQVIQSS